MLAPGEALRAWGQPYTTKEPAKRAIEVSQFFCRLLCRLKTLHMLTPPRSAFAARGANTLSGCFAASTPWCVWG